MVEVVGDVLIPSELIIPEKTGNTNSLAMSGASLYVSGAKLYFNTGATIEKITSA